MKSKYFLRGMGVGILVTVMIFAVSLVFYEPDISDEEIIEKATALGMVQSDKESDSSSSDNDKSSESEENSKESEEESKDSTGSVEEDTAKDQEVSSSDDSSTKNDTDSTASNQSPLESNSGTDSASDSTSDASVSLINFTVSTGESSYKICENLYRAGLIDDPNSFNQYLEDMGYDDAIRTGNYNIPSGSSYEEIANAISH